MTLHLELPSTGAQIKVKDADAAAEYLATGWSDVTPVAKSKQETRKDEEKPDVEAGRRSLAELQGLPYNEAESAKVEEK